jgi:hypothetical protein
MPINPPRLDDRSFDDLVQEMLERIPAHTPDWTNPTPGDPGVTLLELFAWLGDTLLYRVNLIPERQRLVFLRLLGMQMRPARAASGLVSVTIDNKAAYQGISIRRLAQISKPVPFETRSEMMIQPVVAECYYKRRLTPAEEKHYAAVLPGLQQIYDITDKPTAYITTPAFANGAADKNGLDIAACTLDQSLWLVLLSLDEDPKPGVIDAIRAGLGDGKQVLNVGLVPVIQVDETYTDTGHLTPIPLKWEMSYLSDPNTQAVGYTPLNVIPEGDGTNGLTRQGVVRLLLPSAAYIGAPSNDVRISLQAGVGDRPPRLDDPKKNNRLVAWMRLRPGQAMESLKLSWIGINAIDVDARQTLSGRIVGRSDGSSDQEMHLPVPPGQPVERKTLAIEVEEPGQGYRAWQMIEDLTIAGRDPVYSLDSEAAMIRFGDGVRGRVPPQGSRVRAALVRAGGGMEGNLPPGSLTELRAWQIDNHLVTAKLKVFQPLPMQGGVAAETLSEAEKRIPALFRHKDRAVNRDDYMQLAADTPGVSVGRVEVIPRFKPHQRRTDVPGVVSVLVLPYKSPPAAPNPRVDRPFLESVFAYLDARRPLTTELYVIGCEYVKIGLSVAITVRDGFGEESTAQAVKDALNGYLWPLVPGGLNGAGWELGRAVRDQELTVVVSRVPGVLTMEGLKLFKLGKNQKWSEVRPVTPTTPAEVFLEQWQLPELVSVAINTRGDLPASPDPVAASSSQTGTDGQVFGVPVVPEVCA